MSSTDAALAWTHFLDAACTSSPVPTSASPDFTDWLRISPTTTDSPTTQPSSQPRTSSPPFKDVSSSSRVNISQHGGFGLNYLYDIPDFFNSANPRTETDNSANLDLRIEDIFPSSVPPGLYNRHHRMLSLESTSATLINTPSPRSLALFSPSGAVVRQADNRSAAHLSPTLVASPATKFMQELQCTSFGNYYHDFPAPSLLADSLSDISPVVRSDKLQEPITTPERPNTKPKRKRKNRHNRNLPQPPSFVEKLGVGPSLSKHLSTPVLSAQLALEPVSPLPEVHLESAEVMGSTQPFLLSPCHFVSAHSLTHFRGSPEEAVVHGSYQQNVAVSQSLEPAFASPTISSTSLAALSPLSPLTPLSSSPSSPDPPKITLKLKRKIIDFSTPVRPGKRPRGRTVTESPLSSPLSIKSSPEQILSENSKPVFTVRTLPPSIEISSNFPMFYRRFPSSSYCKSGHSDSPCDLFGVLHPGGVYNPPRSALDLYTPRFVKGKGVEKMGLCPTCIEPLDRGGENKKLWFAMKFSAFKSYHMQYTHGISASTGRPFSPPIAFRTLARQNPGKNEKQCIQQGKCHKCAKWILIEGVKDMESKVKELHWWKHAAACHHGSNLEGEGDYYEEDTFLSTILPLQIGPT